MEDFLEESMSYAGFIESSAQDKYACTLNKLLCNQISSDQVHQ